MSLKYHPDKQGGSTRDFQRIAMAYETLSDPAKRHAYNDGADLKKKEEDSEDSDQEEKSLREEVERILARTVCDSIGLDAVVAWSMRLTDKPLPKGSISHIWHPDREIEGRAWQGTCSNADLGASGHSNMVPEAVEVMNQSLGCGDQPLACIRLTWGITRTRGQRHCGYRTNFRGPSLSDTQWSLSAVASTLKGYRGGPPASLRRLDMTWGDSLATVPEFHRKNPDVKLCELIFIDGGHSYDVAIRDLKNFAALANLKNNVLLLDDTFLDDVRRAWDEMMDMGYVEERPPPIGQERPFDRMNSLVAHLLNNLTSSMRFEGSLNLDLNEITMNLVPFPRMHFLLASMSPLYFGRDPRFVSRGAAPTWHWPFWFVALHRLQMSTVKDFSRLYNRKAHVHHYTEYMEKGEFDEAFETVNALIKDYIHLDMLQLCRTISRALPRLLDNIVTA
eukprot:Skav218257  [mRNA]  locus=scaffold2035:113736:130136:- [translate_table: standard]